MLRQSNDEAIPSCEQLAARRSASEIGAERDLRFGRENGIICALFERQIRKMKEGIHPTYVDATITCACGNVIKTRSTKKEMQVNTCSACHPYFTGQKTMVDTEGRVDTFKKRYAKFQKKA